jgi:hypothetical protein
MGWIQGSSVRQDPRAVERPGFAKEDFHVDWRTETVACPQGIVSPRWKPTVADGKPRLSVLFRRADCRACTVRQQCTGNVDGKGRHLLFAARNAAGDPAPEPSTTSASESAEGLETIFAPDAPTSLLDMFASFGPPDSTDATTPADPTGRQNR